MRSNYVHTWMTGLLLSAAVPAAVSADLNLSTWSHSGWVEELPAGPEGWVITSTPESPFYTLESRQVGDTLLEVAYDFSFDQQAGEFNLLTNHAVRSLGYDETPSWARGSFLISPDVDTEVSIVGAAEAWLPSEGIYASISLHIVDPFTEIEYFYTIVADEAPPGQSNFDINDIVILPAGNSYVIAYDLILMAHPNATPDSIGLAQMDVTLSMAAVPEPAAGGSLAAGLFLLLLRSRRQA